MKKIGIVTGASSGMGREFLLQMAKEYPMLDEIWAIARRTELVDDLKGKVSHSSIRSFMLDMSSKEDLNILEDTLEQEEPQVLVLANAAGVGMSGPFAKQEKQEIQNMVLVNCNALTQVTYMTLPYMIKGSRIYQFASAAGFAPQPNFAVYAATKAYVIRFSEALRAELRKKGIGVTAVCPGPVKTEFLKKAYKHKKMNKVKQLVTATPRNVIKKAIKDGNRNRSLSIYGIPMKVTRVICKVIPESFFR